MEIKSPIERTREKLREAGLIDRLIRCSKGDVQMTPEQIRATTFLINKFMPDLKAIEHSGDIGLHGDFTVNVK